MTERFIEQAAQAVHAMVNSDTCVCQNCLNQFVVGGADHVVRYCLGSSEAAMVVLFYLCDPCLNKLANSRTSGSLNLTIPHDVFVALLAKRDSMDVCTEGDEG